MQKIDKNPKTGKKLPDHIEGMVISVKDMVARAEQIVEVLNESTLTPTPDNMLGMLTAGVMLLRLQGIAPEAVKAVVDAVLDLTAGLPFAEPISSTLLTPEEALAALPTSGKVH